MSASLVGSEMCIRDRSARERRVGRRVLRRCSHTWRLRMFPASEAQRARCLLYTSDAADDM
eukprot:3797092-Alexandrium_andersonii.AAC.1